MRVLFATPYSQATGGIVQWARHIVQHHTTNPNGVELNLLPMNNCGVNDAVTNKRLYSRITRGVVTYTRVIKSLKHELDTTRYDILHIATSASISLVKDLWMMRIAKRKGIKSILHFHFGRIPSLAKERNWEWRLIVKAVRTATKVIVIDKASYDTLKREGFTNIELLPNPLSPMVSSLIEKYKTAEREPRRLLFVGHCVTTKGVYELVEACAKIEGVHLRLVGPITEGVKQNLEKIADGNDWLDIVGCISLEEVIREMCRCSIFVLPTYTEGFPNVIIESMAAGAPIITTPVGAIPEMLDITSDSPCGICVAPKQVEPLREAIEQLLQNNDLAALLGQRAKERVTTVYAMSSVWDKLCNIWKIC